MLLFWPHPLSWLRLSSRRLPVICPAVKTQWGVFFCCFFPLLSFFCTFYTRHEGSFMAPWCLWTGTLSVTGQVWRTNPQKRSASSYLANLRRLVFSTLSGDPRAATVLGFSFIVRYRASSTLLPFKPDHIEFPVNMCAADEGSVRIIGDWMIIWIRSRVKVHTLLSRYQSCNYQPALFRF